MFYTNQIPVRKKGKKEKFKDGFIDNILKEMCFVNVISISASYKA
jgi:hypothetical protein